MKSGEARFVALVLALVLATQLALHASMLRSFLFNDEGHFLAYSWLTSNGLVIYRDFFDNHPPLIEFIALVPVRLFGASMPVVRSLTLLAQLATTAIVFLLARKLYGSRAAVAAAIFYAGFEILCCGVWFVIEPFLALSLAASAYALLDWRESGSRRALALCGIAAGLSLLLKPQAIIFAALAAFFVARSSGPKDAARFAAWLLLPVAIAAAWFLANGALFEFAYYSTAFNLLETQGFAKLSLLPYEWLILFLSMPAALAFAGMARRKAKAEDIILLAWFASSLLFAFPRLDIFHFLPSLPPLAVMFGRVACAPLRGFSATLREWLLPALAMLSFAALFALLLQSAFRDETAGEIAIGAYFSSHTQPGERIAAYAFRPQLYVYADRLPASYYISTPQWVMNERSEARTISDLEATRPGLIYLSDAAFDRDETMKGYAPALYAYLRGHYSAVYIFRDASFALQRAG